MSKALPYIAAAGTFLATGSFQAAQAAFFITSLAVNALDPPKKPGAAERQASVTTLSLGEQSRELLIGETCTAGTLVDAFNFGGKYGTDTVTRCIAVADHAIDSVVGYYIGDQYYPWTVDGIQPGFSNKLSIRFYNATADGHAPQAHVLAAGWSASDRLAGMAVFWVDTQYDEKVWPQGHPQFKFVLRGLRAYDMRFDPAFGYTGPNPQTWEDRASHVHTRNAAVLRYAFTRGIYAEGHQGDPDYLLIGRGLSAEEAPPERIIAAANLCDEVVDGGPRYTANGVIRASDAFITVEEMFSAAMAGQIVQREGGVEVVPGQAKAAVLTITDGDLVVGEPVSFSAFLPDTDGGRINSVTPRYVSPAQNWRDFAGPVRRNVADIAADGGPREATLSLLLVTDGGQADRCAEIMRKAARLERRATIVLPPECATLEEGDWIAWRSDRYHGGATVRYYVETWKLDEKWRMRLSLCETASSVFGVPDPVDDAVPAPPPPPVPVDALILDGVTAEAITLPGDTSAMPAVRFTWDTPVDAAVLAIRAEVRRAGETEIATGRADDFSLGVMVMSNGVPADAAIEARLVPIGDPSRPVLASPWVTLSTTSLVAGDVSATSPVATALRDAIEQARADLEAAQEVADDQIEALNATVYTAVTGLKAQTDSLFSDVNAATTGLKAKTDALLSTLNTPATGLIARVASAETQITDNNTATVESLRVLDARARTVPNLIAGGDFSGDLTGLWSANDVSSTVPAYYDGRVGSHVLINGATNFLASKTYALTPGAFLSLSFDGQATAPGAVGAYIQWLPSYETGANIAGFASAANNWETRKRSPSNPAPAPAGTTGFRVVLVRNGSADFYVSRVKVNTGGEAADWSDEATISDSRARLTSLDRVVTTPTSGLVSRMLVLESTIDTPGTGVAARLTTLNNIITTPTTGLVAKTAVLESTVNTPVTGVSARLGTLEQVITTPTTGLAAKVTALETAINTPLTGLSARIGSSELAIADLNLNKASAERVSFLEAYSRSVVNSVINSDFSQGAYKWSGGTAWGYNTAGGDLGPYAVTYVAGQQFLLSDFFPLFGDTDYGFSVLGDGGSVPAQAGIYVAEFVDNGSGAPGALLRDSLAPVSMVGATWNKPVHSAGFTSGPTARWGRVALYKNGGTSSAAFSKIMFHRGKAPVAWNDNQTDLNALSRLSLAETAITSNNTAAASRLFLLETSVNTAGTGLSARMGSAENAISDLNTGKASAERVAFLEARTRTAPNLIPNSTANGGAKGWSVLNSPFIAADPAAADGGRFIMPSGGSGIYAALQTDFFPVYGNSRYSFQGEIYAQGLTAGDVRAYISYYNAAGGVVLYQVFLTNVDRGWYLFKLENLQVPASAVKANCTIDVLNATVTVAAWRRLKLENGPICTFWSDDATDIMTSARLTTAETAITTNNTAAVGRLQILEAAVTTPLTGLSAKVASHDSAIADLNTGKASASSVSLLEVRSQTLPNLISNPQFSNGFDNWYVDGVNGASIQTDAQVGRYVNITGAYIASDPPKPAFAGMQVSFSFDGDDGGAADAAVYVQWLPSYASGAFLSNFGRSWTNRKFCNGDTGAVAPAGTTGFRIVAARGASSAFNIARIKCNYGPKATAWSNEAEANDVYARITDTSTVALDAQGKANASRTLVLDVGGNISGTQSINNGITSAFNVLGDKFSVVAPGGGDRTEYLAAYGSWFVHSPLTATRTRYGKAFNSSQMIVWWTGPDSVPIGSETKANAYVYISQNATGGPRFGGSDTGSGPTFTASAPNVRVKTQVGGSTTVTTAAVAITTAGATGGITYTWTNTFGDPSMVANYSDGSSATFSSTIPGVGRVQTIWTWTAYDSGTGISRSGQVFVTIQRDA